MQQAPSPREGRGCLQGAEEGRLAPRPTTKGGDHSVSETGSGAAPPSTRDGDGVSSMSAPSFAGPDAAGGVVGGTGRPASARTGTSRALREVVQRSGRDVLPGPGTAPHDGGGGAVVRRVPLEGRRGDLRDRGGREPRREDRAPRDRPGEPEGEPRDRDRREGLLVEGTRDGRDADGPAVRVRAAPPPKGEPRRDRLQRAGDPRVRAMRVREGGGPPRGTLEAGTVREPRADVDPGERVLGRRDA